MGFPGAQLCMANFFSRNGSSSTFQLRSKRIFNIIQVEKGLGATQRNDIRRHTTRPEHFLGKMKENLDIFFVMI